MEKVSCSPRLDISSQKPLARVTFWLCFCVRYRLSFHSSTLQRIAQGTLTTPCQILGFHANIGSECSLGFPKTQTSLAYHHGRLFLSAGNTSSYSSWLETWQKEVRHIASKKESAQRNGWSAAQPSQTNSLRNPWMHRTTNPHFSDAPQDFQSLHSNTRDPPRQPITSEILGSVTRLTNKFRSGQRRRHGLKKQM